MRERHWSTLVVFMLVLLSILGAIIGIELLTSLGVTPKSIIGALIAMIIGRIPLKALGHFRSIHVQNLAQTTISAEPPLGRQIACS